MKKFILSSLLFLPILVTSCSGNSTREISAEEAQEIISNFKKVDIHSFSMTEESSFVGETKFGALSIDFSANSEAETIADDTEGDEYFFVKSIANETEGQKVKKDDYVIALDELKKNSDAYILSSLNYGLNSSTGNFDENVNETEVDQDSARENLKYVLDTASSLHYNQLNNVLNEETIYTLNNGLLSIETNIDENDENINNQLDAILPQLGVDLSFNDLDLTVKVDFDENGYITYLNIAGTLDLDVEYNQISLNINGEVNALAEAAFNKEINKSPRFDDAKEEIDNLLASL